MRHLGILATVLLIFSAAHAHAKGLDIGVAMRVIDQGVSNLRNWQSPDPDKEKSGLPVQFINLDKEIYVTFSADGAVSCDEHQDMGPWKKGTPPHVNLPPGGQSSCSAGKDSTAPFAVWWIYAGENDGPKPLINVGRGSVVVFVDLEGSVPKLMIYSSPEDLANLKTVLQSHSGSMDWKYYKKRGPDAH